MSLAILIIKIILYIPTIINIIHEIMDIIHQLNGAEKKAAEQQLSNILKGHVNQGLKGVPLNGVSVKAELEQFHSDLKSKYGL